MYFLFKKVIICKILYANFSKEDIQLWEDTVVVQEVAAVVTVVPEVPADPEVVVAVAARPEPLRPLLADAITVLIMTDGEGTIIATQTAQVLALRVVGTLALYLH